jgi:predicted GNAT superfamily acetyltransferase
MSQTVAELEIRECLTVEDFETCIALQREAFGLPDIEISPRRHFIVSHSAGGWTLGAFAGGRMVGFVHHLVALRGDDEIIGYSHMMAVAREFQNRGVGALLKWAQRARAMTEGRRFIKWTWDPMQARNAHFNLNRLGAVVRAYAENFYGTDYPVNAQNIDEGIDSDRLFAEWELDSPRVEAIALGTSSDHGIPVVEIAIPPDWLELVRKDRRAARREQLRVRDEFQSAFSRRLVCKGFERDERRPRYLLFEDGS